MDSEVSVQLYDAENNTVYTLNLNRFDAERCETDLEFTQRLLRHAKMLEKVQKNKQRESEGTSTTVAGTRMGGNEEKAGWSYNETLALIAAYDSFKENFQIVTKRKFVWEDIANHITSNGFERSALQCETKWRNLMRTYKNVKDLRKGTGRGAIKFQFFTQIDEILGDKPAISCTHTFSTAVASTSAAEDERTTSDTDVQMSTQSETKLANAPDKKGKKRKNSDEVLRKKNEELIDMKIQYFKKKQQEREASDLKRDKKVEIKEKMLKLEEKKVALLEKYLQK